MHQSEPSSPSTEESYQLDMSGHQLASLIVLMSGVTRRPVLVVSGPFMLRLTQLRSQHETASRLQELLSTAHTRPVEIALNSSSIAVFTGYSTSKPIVTKLLSESLPLLGLK